MFFCGKKPKNAKKTEKNLKNSVFFVDSRMKKVIRFNQAQRKGLLGLTFKIRSFIVNKSELIAEIAKNGGFSKTDAAKAVDSFVACVTKSLKKGNSVTLVGFGTFDVKKRAATTGRNPQTGATIKIAACKQPKFRAGKALKDAVN